MNYDHLKYFLFAAEKLNFSEAARQLHISPQAFGRQVSLFEQEIGMTLFDRTGYKKTLTPDGQLVYKHLSQLSSALESEYEMLRAMGIQKQNQLSMGILSFLPREKYASPVIAEIFSANPGLNLNVKMYEMNELEQQLRDGLPDFAIAIRQEDASDIPGYDYLILDRGAIQVGVSLYSHLVVRDRLTLDDLANENMVRFPIEFPEVTDRYTSYPCKETLFVDNLATMLNTVEQGKCYCLITPKWCDPYETRKIKFFPLPDRELVFNLMFLYRKNMKSDRLKETLDSLRDLFGV